MIVQHTTVPRQYLPSQQRSTRSLWLSSELGSMRRCDSGVLLNHNLLLRISAL